MQQEGVEDEDEVVVEAVEEGALTGVVEVVVVDAVVSIAVAIVMEDETVIGTAPNVRTLTLLVVTSVTDVVNQEQMVVAGAAAIVVAVVVVEIETTAMVVGVVAMTGTEIETALIAEVNPTRL